VIAGSTENGLFWGFQLANPISVITEILNVSEKSDELSWLAWNIISAVIDGRLQVELAGCFPQVSAAA
jgi:hypothetical protein